MPLYGRMDESQSRKKEQIVGSRRWIEKRKKTFSFSYFGIIGVPMCVPKVRAVHPTLFNERYADSMWLKSIVSPINNTAVEGVRGKEDAELPTQSYVVLLRTLMNGEHTTKNCTSRASRALYIVW